jgi:hypothetical protein
MGSETMRIRSFGYALSSCAAAAFLAACSELSLPIGAMQQAGAVATRSESWMLQEAKGKDLLYIANTDSGARDTGTVTVYTYPQGELVGDLKGFTVPQGLCVDKAGDVYIVNSYGGDIIEYAHGGTKPIKTLTDTGLPYGCAIDPKTGNLAVTNWCDGPQGSCYSKGTVLIYKDARGTPKVLTDPYTAIMYYCTYDKSGDLFVDGVAKIYDIGFAKLPKDSTQFQNMELTLPNKPQAPGGLQWAGRYLAASAIDGNAVYEYQLTGDQGKLVHVTPLKKIPNGSGTNQFSISGQTVVAELITSDRYPNGRVYLFNYPAGGKPTEAIVQSINGPEAATISPAEK